MNHSKYLFASLLLLTVVAAAGCKGSANKNRAAGSPGTASSGASRSGKGDPQALDALTKSINAQLSARSFRARLDSTFNDQEMARTIEFVAPDRFHMTGEHDEMIIANGQAWARLNGGAWQLQAVDVSQIIASVRDSKAVDALRKSTDVTLIGPDTLDGKPMTVYEYTTRIAAGKGITSHAKAWISTADDLPRRIETEAEINGKPSKATITYFDYDADIHIEPPK